LPYSVTEKSFDIKVIQKKAFNKHAVFFVSEAETRTMQNERDCVVLKKLDTFY